MHPVNIKYPEEFLENIRRNIKENPLLVNVMSNLEHVIGNFKGFEYPTARLKDCPYYGEKDKKCIYKNGECSFLMREGCYLHETVYPDIKKFLSGNRSH